jgi:hypothetical protein
LRLVWRQRCERVGDVDHVARLVEQESALAGVVLPLGLLRQFDGAAAIGEGTAGVMIDKAAHGAQGSITPVVCCFRRASADRCGGGSPSQICAGLRVSARWRASTSISRALISSGETLGATLVKDGRCLVPRGDMASKNTDSEIQVNGISAAARQFCPIKIRLVFWRGRLPVSVSGPRISLSMFSAIYVLRRLRLQLTSRECQLCRLLWFPPHTKHQNLQR